MTTIDQNIETVTPLDTDRLTIRELARLLAPEVQSLGDGFEYFSASTIITMLTPHRYDEPIGYTRWISCYAVTGGSEGHYVHVDRIYMKGKYDREYTHEPLFLVKTFGGYVQACEIAAYLGARLGA